MPLPPHSHCCFLVSVMNMSHATYRPIIQDPSRHAAIFFIYSPVDSRDIRHGFAPSCFLDFFILRTNCNCVSHQEDLTRKPFPQHSEPTPNSCAEKETAEKQPTPKEARGPIQIPMKLESLPNGSSTITVPFRATRRLITTTELIGRL